MSTADEIEKQARAALAPQVEASLRLSATLQLAAIQARAAGLDEAGWGQVCAVVWGAVAKAWKASEEQVAAQLSRSPDARVAFGVHLMTCPICQVAAAGSETYCSVGAKLLDSAP